MYYEETIINGELHFKTTPNGEWKRMTREQLTQELLRVRDRLDSALYELSGTDPKRHEYS